MSNRIVVCSSGLAFLLPAILGLSCVKRNWDFCAPNAPCKPGFTCTADWQCVRSTDAGSDGLVVIDSRGSTDAAGAADGLMSAVTDGANGPATGQDARGSDSAPISATPDGPASAAPDGQAAIPEAPAPDAPGTAPDTPTASPDGPPPVIPDAPSVVVDAAVSNLPDARLLDSPPDAAAPDAPPTPPVDAAGSCSSDRDCPSQKPLCLANQCAKCTADNDCAGRSGTPACVLSSGLCAACTADKHCTGVAGTCDLATNQCVGCVTRDDCAGACQTCSPGGVCTAVKGQDDPGRCAGTCDSTGACKSKQGQSCQTVASGCAAGTTCSPDGVCCNTACGQTCHSCLGSKTGGVDGICANETTGTACGSGQYCNAGSCGTGCLIGGTLYASGAVSSTNPCQTCQPSVSRDSWSPLANGTGCGSGQICSGGNCQTGCWIGGSFVGSGAPSSGNICQICSPTKSTTGWSNNDAHTGVSCGTCGGAESCVNMVLSACSKTTGTFYQDLDGDGYGNPLVTPVAACTAPAGWVAQSGDCDDRDVYDHPGSTECDSLDSNTLWTCSSSGSRVTSTCSNGCAGGQCRTFPFPTVNVAGVVTCGTLQCPASQGCSFGEGWTGQPVCGSPFKYYQATCDGQSDCPFGQVCCWVYSGGSDAGVSCVANDGNCPHFQAGTNAYLICDPNQPDSCPPESTCTMLSPYSTYYCRPN